MAIESDWLDLFNATITVEPFASESHNGTVTYGSSYTVPCFIDLSTKTWNFKNAIELETKNMIYFSHSAVTAKDRITLPSGYDPRVVISSVFNRFDDDSGVYHHHEIAC